MSTAGVDAGVDGACILALVPAGGLTIVMDVVGEVGEGGSGIRMSVVDGRGCDFEGKSCFGIGMEESREIRLPLSGRLSLS